MLLLTLIPHLQQRHHHSRLFCMCHTDGGSWVLRFSWRTPNNRRPDSPVANDDTLRNRGHGPSRRTRERVSYQEFPTQSL